MKKIIRKIIILFLSVGLCALPTQIIRKGYSYTCIYRTFFTVASSHFASLFKAINILETLLTLLSFCLVALYIWDIVKTSRITQILATTFIGADIVLWLIRIFVPLQNHDGSARRLSLLQMFDGKEDFWWLLLYFAFLLTLLVLIILPYLPRHRHPSKGQQLEQRVAALEKQVSEQENKE